MPNISDKERENIEKIRQGLKRHWGAMDEVARRAGVGRIYVYKVLKGQHVSAKVLDAATAVLLEREQTAVALRRSIEHTLRQVEELRPTLGGAKAMVG